MSSLSGAMGGGDRGQYSSFVDVLVQTYKGAGGLTAGVRALYRGAMARVRSCSVLLLLLQLFLLGAEG